MKLGINATFLNEKPTGVCVYAGEISRAVAGLHNDTVIFSPFDDCEIPAKCLHKVPRGIGGSTRLMNNIFRLLYLNAAMPSLCKKNKIDALYCPITEFPFVSRLPLIVHIHDLHPIHFPSQFGLASRRLKFALSMVNRVVKRVIVSSGFVKDDLLRATNLKEEMIDVVPLAYNAAAFKPVPMEKRRDFLRRYSLEGKYILSVGTLFPYKNLETLIDAFTQIKTQAPHSLVIVGRREFSGNPPINDKRIIFMDYVPAQDLPCFYSFADMLVYPSLMEGFGIAPLEAMGCGAPVLSSNRGSLPEVVGDAAVLFDPLNSGLLARLILDVIANEKLREELIGKGLRHVMKFSWKKTAEGILNSCENAMREKA